jgi:seryl-tRNA synthetase
MPYLMQFLYKWIYSLVLIFTIVLFHIVQVSGSKFYYLKNEAVLLEMALVNWAISEVSKKGFTPLITPEIVRSSVVEKCGFQPRAQNTQV